MFLKNDPYKRLSTLYLRIFSQSDWWKGDVYWWIELLVKKKLVDLHFMLKKFYVAKIGCSEQSVSFFDVLWRVWIRNGLIKIVHYGRTDTLYKQKQWEMLLFEFKRNGNNQGTEILPSQYDFPHMSDHAITIMYLFNLAFYFSWSTINSHILRTTNLSICFEAFRNRLNLWIHRTHFDRIISQSN